MEKIKLLISIDDNLNRELRAFIAEKHRNYERGLLSYEVTEAIKHWIKIHTDAQTCLAAKAPNPTFGVSMIFTQVKQYLIKKYYQEINAGAVIPSSYLKEAIMQVRGSDKRTVAKWLRIFNTFHLIKYLNPATWEFM